MAFTHGKRGRLWVDGYELTSYFNDFTMAAKAGIAETTVYGLGAKTFIGGLKEGQIMAKGYFGASALDTEDPVLSQALGRQQNMAVLFTPTGDHAPGDRVIVAYAAETDLEIMTPVANVVATSMTAQADSGLSTGSWLYDPDATPVPWGGPFTPVAIAMGDHDTTFSTTINAYAAGVDLTTPDNPIYINDITGWPTSGEVIIQTGVGNTVTIRYSSLSTAGTHGPSLGPPFQVVSTTGTSPWTSAAGQTVTLVPSALGGSVFLLELESFSSNASSGSPAEVYFYVEGSIDNDLWTFLGTWGPFDGQTANVPNHYPSPDYFSSPQDGQTLTTGATFVVSRGTPVPPYLRLNLDWNVGSSTTWTLKFGAAVANQ